MKRLLTIGLACLTAFSGASVADGPAQGMAARQMEKINDAKRRADWKKASEIVVAAFEEGVKSGWPSKDLLVLHDEGHEIFHSLENLVRAQEFDERSLSVFSERGDRAGISRAKVHLAYTLSWRNEYDRAITLAEQLLTENKREPKLIDDYAAAASVRASMHHGENEFDACAALLEPIVAETSIFEKANADVQFSVLRWLAICHRDLAYYSNEPQYQTALAYAQTAVDALQDAPGASVLNIPIGLESVSRIQWRMELKEQAITTLTKALTLMEEGGADAGRDYVLMASFLTYYLTATEKFYQAAAWGEKAASVARSVFLARHYGPGGANSDDRVFLSFAANAYLSALDERMKAGEPLSEQERNDGFRIAQLTMSSALSDAMSVGAHAAANRSQDLRRLAQRAEALERERRVFEDQLTLLAGAPEKFAKAIARKQKEKSKIERNIRKVRARILEEDRVYAALWNIDGVSAADAMAVLDDDEMLVLITGYQNFIHVFAATKDDLFWHAPVFANHEFCEMSRRLRTSLSTNTDVDCAAGMGSIIAASQEMQDFDADIAYDFYKRLLEPAVEALGEKSQWILSVNGFSQTLTYGALLTEPPEPNAATARDYSQFAFLGREKSLLFTPTIRAFVGARADDIARDSDASPFQLSLAGAPCIGRYTGPDCDAVMRRDFDARAGRRLTITTSAVRGADLTEADATQLATLPELPGAYRELRAVQAAFPMAEDFVGAGFTETALKARRWATSDVLSIATHALSPGELGLAEPALVLSPPKAGSKEDGLLTGGEIAQMDLPFSWVVLSGCHTASADGDRRGEIYTGLALSFLQAGSEALLVTQFEIQDAASAAIIPATLTAYRTAADGSKSDALRSATNKLLNDPNQAHLHHPSSWAPFVVLGATP